MQRTTLRAVIAESGTEYQLELPEGIRRIRAWPLSDKATIFLSLNPGLVESGISQNATLQEPYDSGIIYRDTGPLYFFSDTPGNLIEVEIIHREAGTGSPTGITCKNWGTVSGQPPVNDATFGAIPWTQLPNWFNASADVVAELDVTENQNTSQYVLALAWRPLNGLIPASASIQQITVDLNCYSQQVAGADLDIEIGSLKLVKDGVIGGTDFVESNGGGEVWNRITPQLRSYSPAGDPLWGRSWSPSDFTTYNSDNPRVQVETLQQGSAPTNKIQRVRLPSTVSGGTFTLTFSGQTTGAIDYNESAADLTTLLNALSNIAPGDVVVTLNTTSDWNIEFSGAYAGVNVPMLTGNGTNLTLTGGGSIQIATQRDGGNGNTIFRFTAWQSTEGNSGAAPMDTAPLIDTVEFWYNAYSDPHSYNDFESYIPGVGGNTLEFYQSLLEGCAHINEGDITVTEGTKELAPGVNQYYIDVEFTGAKSGQDWRLGWGEDQCEDDRTVSIKWTAQTSWGHFRPDSTLAEASQCGSGSPAIHNWGVLADGGPVNEVQLVTILNSPLGGTFTLSFQGQTTGAIAYNASALDVATALIALSNIGVDDVVVTKSGWTYTITFENALAGTDVAELTATPSLTGAAVIVSTVQNAGAGRNEKQKIRSSAVRLWVSGVSLGTPGVGTKIRPLSRRMRLRLLSRQHWKE